MFNVKAFPRGAHSSWFSGEDAVQSFCLADDPTPGRDRSTTRHRLKGFQGHLQPTVQGPGAEDQEEEKGFNILQLILRSLFYKMEVVQILRFMHTCHNNDNKQHK